MLGVVPRLCFRILLLQLQSGGGANVSSQPITHFTQTDMQVVFDKYIKKVPTKPILLVERAYLGLYTLSISGHRLSAWERIFIGRFRRLKLNGSNSF